MDRGEVDKAFRDWTLSDASDEQLVEMLRHLCSDAIPNDYIRHRELLRGITINHIQMARVIRDLKATMHELNTVNEKTQQFLLILTVVAVVVGALQVILAFIH